MTPQEAQTISQFVAAGIAQEMRATLGVLRAAPEGRLDYRPDPVSKTALGLLRHIALEDEWFLNSIAAGSFTPPPDDSDACGIDTPEQAAAYYAERIPAALDRVRALTGEELARNIDFFGMMNMPAVGFLSLMSHHSVHHRGQLSSYLRAMGGKVPSIYGPSADTANG